MRQRPRLRRTAYTSNPRANAQFNRIVREAATELDVSAHAEMTGGTHGIPANTRFESVRGAQEKATAALDAAKEYTDGKVQQAIEQLRQGGTTSQRPAYPEPFTMYFDTTLGIPIWWNGNEWVDATGATV